MKIKPLIYRLQKAVIITALATGLLLPFCVNSTAGAADLFGGAKGEACSAVDAADASGNCDPNKLEGAQGTLSTTLKHLLDLLSIVVGIMSVIMIVISGIRFVTSNGDSNSITSARNTFIYALVGLVIVAFAQLIVKLVITRI